MMRKVVSELTVLPTGFGRRVTWLAYDPKGRHFHPSCFVQTGVGGVARSHVHEAGFLRAGPIGFHLMRPSASHFSC